jgi:glycerol-3-phosphate dehydrogenase
VRRYGRRWEEVARLLTPALARPVVAGEPDLLVELAYQRDHEMAVLPEDFLLRRTRLGLFHPELLRWAPCNSAAALRQSLSSRSE